MTTSASLVDNTRVYILLILLIIMVKATCTTCTYNWESNSKMFKVSCPSCGNKVKIRELRAAKDVESEKSD